jgi:hypothetical protein
MANWCEQRSWRLVCLYLLMVDIGLLLYWAVAIADVLPAEWLFKGYRDPIISAWNWSFLPLDLLASVTGLAGVACARRQRQALGECLILLSLCLTFCAGLMALSFWALTADYDPSWWGANVCLMVPSALLLGMRLGGVRR